MVKQKSLKFFYPAIFLAFCSCLEQANVKEIINQSNNIVELQPDSALKLLHSVLYPENLDQKTFNKYYLLLMQAKDKSYKEITSDTLIFAVKEYYIQKKDYANAALAAFYCGRVLHEQNDVDKAAKAYLDAGEWADRTHNDNLKGLILSSLGVLYYKHLSYEKAITVSKEAIAKYDKAENYKNKISTLELIGKCFSLDNKIDSAFHYFSESLKLADDKQIPHLQSSVRQCMGIACRQKGSYEQAKKLFAEALSLLSDSIEQARIGLSIAQIYVLENKMDSVKFYLDQAMELSINDPWIMRFSSLLLSKLKENNKLYQEALEYYKEYYLYTTKVFDSERNNKFLELQEKYNFEKLKNSKNQLMIKHQQSIILLTGILLITVIILLVYYFQSLQNKKLLLETERKIIGLQNLAHNFSNKHRNILLQYSNILKKVALIENEITDNERKNGQKLLKKFNTIVYEKDAFDWDKLYQAMNDFQNGLYDTVKEKYPKWKEIEFRVFCLTCEKIDDLGITVLLNQTTSMVRKMRNKIREDIGMSKYSHNFISHIKEKLSISD